jgi:hypothetical protein
MKPTPDLLTEIFQTSIDAVIVVNGEGEIVLASRCTSGMTCVSGFLCRG